MVVGVPVIYIEIGLVTQTFNTIFLFNSFPTLPRPVASSLPGPTLVVGLTAAKKPLVAQLV
jgi:hypothetical protein